MYCICCKKDNIILDDMMDREHPITEEEYLWMDKTMSNGRKINVNDIHSIGGITQTLNAGYGSSHDTDQIIVAICDECIKENLESGFLLYRGNYIHPNHPYTTEQVEKSKRIYRRNKNLDRIDDDTA